MAVARTSSYITILVTRKDSYKVPLLKVFLHKTLCEIFQVCMNNLLIKKLRLVRSAVL